MMVSGMQIGPNDNVAQVLSKTGRARQWLAERPTVPDDVACLESTPTVFRVSAHIAEDTPAVRSVFKPAFARLEAVTGGRIAAKEHWGGSLHPERDGAKALRGGVTDFCPVYSAWSPDEFPAAQVLALPFLFPSAELATTISEELYSRLFKEDVERQGILMGRMVSTGCCNLFSRVPIRGRRDLLQGRVACTDGIESDAFRALGAEPVPCSTPEAVRLFGAGQVLALSISDSAAHTTGAYRFARYRTSIDMIRLSLEYCLSPSFYDRLPLPLKRALNDWLRGLAQVGAQIFYGLEGARAREEFALSGIETVCIGPEEEVGWRLALKPLTADFEARLYSGSARGALVSDIRSLVTRYGGLSSDELMDQAIASPRRDMLPGLQRAPAEDAAQQRADSLPGLRDEVMDKGP